MKYYLLPLSLLLLVHFSFAQTSERSDTPAAPERRPGELLVQFSGAADLQKTLALLNEAGRGTVTLQKNIAPNWQIYLLRFDENQVVAAGFLANARRIPGIRAAQWNYRAVERSIEPNDTEWWRQDDMTLIGAPDAWGSSTGGLTLGGDTIVVAVLEKGILLSHPDIAPNRWYNRAETPNNDLDDDNNGYADDYGGWDARNGGDGTGGNNNHGTGVTGIIGARGNNALGITGVNWNVKLMGISNVEFEDEIIEAYYYAGNARRLYNQTNGTKGAFVVVTNASFGLDKEHAEEHPLWCAVYDSLGQVGILGVGATTNQNTNVDVDGDMPTSCTSEFLITVNNVNKLGSKMPSTGYGAVSIDLGAPGNDTYTTANGGLNNPTYNVLGGTSSATPHVTGAVALLYSMPCDMLTNDALTNPAACARRVRDIILGNVEPETTLAGITATGGYLHIGNSADAVRELCEGLTGPLEIVKVETIGRDFYRVYYQTPTFDKYQFRVFNMLGQLLYEKELTPQQFGVNYVEYDGSNLPAGIYTMSVGRNNTVTSRKFPKF
ncbi:MAG TPA: S8 family peptidase [Saprospiraceae bacterium]|nr:S8 family peptidase [Saprospiraceae bacterium]